MSFIVLGLLAGPPGASPAPRKNIPVPLGFWVGSGKLSEVTADVSGVEVHITRGTYWIDLISDPRSDPLDVTGDLRLDFFGSGVYDFNGVEAAGNFTFHGVFELGDFPNEVYADGAYRMTGVVIVNGFDVPIDQTLAVSSPIAVTDATCTKIRGELPSGLGAYRWTAKLKFSLGVRCS